MISERLPTSISASAVASIIIALVTIAASLIHYRLHPEHARSQTSTSNNLEPVNAIVGDAGYAAVFGRMPDWRSREQVRIAAHLFYVEQILRARSTDHLTPRQARRRAAALNLLRAYRLDGIFPHNTTHPGQRTPVFIDGDGRICAVGYLIAQTVGREVAESINDRYQFARISEIDAPLLPEWAEQHGFTLRELGMIQPAYCWRDPTPAGCIEEDENPASAVEITSIGLNAGSALLNGWMATRSGRNVYVAGGGLLLGGAGLGIGMSEDADYRAATLATAGASILLSGWHLLRRAGDDDRGRPGEQVAGSAEIRPTWIAGGGVDRPGLRIDWTF